MLIFFTQKITYRSSCSIGLILIKDRCLGILILSFTRNCSAIDRLSSIQKRELCNRSTHLIKCLSSKRIILWQENRHLVSIDTFLFRNGIQTMINILANSHI